MGSQYYRPGKRRGAANDPSGMAYPVRGHAWVAPRPLSGSQTPSPSHVSCCSPSLICLLHCCRTQCPIVGRAKILSREDCGDKGLVPACVYLDLILSKHEAGLLCWERELTTDKQVILYFENPGLSTCRTLPSMSNLR